MLTDKACGVHALSRFKRAHKGKTLRLALLCRIHNPASVKAIANPRVLTVFARALNLFITQGLHEALIVLLHLLGIIPHPGGHSLVKGVFFAEITSNQWQGWALCM